MESRLAREDAELDSSEWNWLEAISDGERFSQSRAQGPESNNRCQQSVAAEDILSDFFVIQDTQPAGQPVRAEADMAGKVDIGPQDTRAAVTQQFDDLYRASLKIVHETGADRPGESGSGKGSTQAVQVVWQQRIIDLLRLVDYEAKIEGSVARGVRTSIEKDTQFGGTIDQLTEKIRAEGIGSNPEKFAQGSASRFALELTMAWFNARQLDVHKEMIKRRLSLPAGGPFLSAKSTEDNSFHDTYESTALAIQQLTHKDLPNLAKERTTLLIGTKMPTLDQLRAFDDNSQYLRQIEKCVVESRNREQAHSLYRTLKKEIGQTHLDLAGWAPPENPHQLSEYAKRTAVVTNLLRELRHMDELCKELGSLTDTHFDKNRLVNDKLFEGSSGWQEVLLRKLPKTWADTADNNSRLLEMYECRTRHLPYISQAADDYLRGQPIRYYTRQESGCIVFDRETGKPLGIKDKGGAIVAFTRLRGDSLEFIQKGEDGFYAPDGQRHFLTAQEQKKVDDGIGKNFDQVDYGYTIERGTGNESGKLKVTLKKTYEVHHSLSPNDSLQTITETRFYAPDQLARIELKSGQNLQIKADELQTYVANKEMWELVKSGFQHALNISMIAGGGILLRAALAAGSKRLAALGAARFTAGLAGEFSTGLQNGGDEGKALAEASHWFIMGEIAYGLGIGKVIAKPLQLALGKSLVRSESGQAVQRIIDESKWMSQLHVSTHRTSLPCNVFLAYTLGREEIEKHLGMQHKNIAEPGARVENAPLDRQTVAAINKGLNGYESLLAGFAAEKEQGARSILQKTKVLSDHTLRADYLNTVIARYFLPSAEQLKDEKVNNRGLLPADIQYVERTGTSPERIAAAIAALYLSRDQAGRLPDSGVLIQRRTTIPEYSPPSLSSKLVPALVPANPYAGVWGLEGDKVPAQVIDQAVKVEDVLAVLRHEVANAERPQSKIAAADALFQIGAVSAGEYASTIITCLRRDHLSIDKDLQIGLIRQVSDLLVLRSQQTADGSLSHTQWARANKDSGSNTAEDLLRELVALAGEDRDDDTKAMVVAIVHAHCNPERLYQSVDNLVQKFAELKAKGNGAFADHVREYLKGELAVRPDTTEKIDRLLDVVTMLRTCDDRTRDWLGVRSPEIDRALLHALDSFERGFENRTPLAAVRVIDALLLNKEGLQDDQKQRVVDLALSILRMRCPQDGGTLANAQAVMAIIERAGLIALTRESKGEFATELTKMVRARDDGWARYPEVLAGAIKALADTQSVNGATIDVICSLLAFNRNDTNAESFAVKNPKVRAEAAQAILKLANNRYVWGKEADTKSTKAEDGNESRIRTLDLEGLIKRETDPATLSVYYAAWQQIHRIDPDSMDYKSLWEEHNQRLDEVANVRFTFADVRRFITQNQQFQYLDPEICRRELQQESNRAYTEPYTGIVGALKEFIQDDDTIANQRAGAQHKAEVFAKGEVQAKLTKALQALRDSNLNPGDNARQLLLTLKFILLDDQNRLSAKADGHEETSAQQVKRRTVDTIFELCHNNHYPERQLLSMVVQHCIRSLSPTADAYVKFQLYRSYDALLRQQDFKPGRSDRSLSDRMFYEALIKETNDSASDASDSEMLHNFLIDKLYQRRFFGSEALLDALRGKYKDRMPETAKYADAVLSEMRYGIARLYNDTEADKTNSAASVRADYMTSALTDGRFNYEAACKAIFRACKDNPITDESDPRYIVLRQALGHKSERVQLSAAMILSNSKIDKHFTEACDVLCAMATNATKQRYKESASKILEGIITKANAIEKQVIFDQLSKELRLQLMHAKHQDKREQQSDLQSRIDYFEQLDPQMAMQNFKKWPLRISEREMKALDSRCPRQGIRVLDLEPTKEFPSGKKVVEANRGERLRAIREITGNADLGYPDLDAAEALYCRKKAKPDIRAELKLAQPIKQIAAFRPAVSTSHCHASKEFERPELNQPLELSLPPVKPCPVMSELAQYRTPGPVDLPSWGLHRRQQPSALEESAISLFRARYEQLKNVIADPGAARQRRADAFEKMIDVQIISCQTLPIRSSDDERIAALVALTQNKESPKAAMAAATIILAGPKDQPAHPGFSSFQRQLAERKVCENAAHLLLQLGTKDEQALLLLDKGLAALSLRDGKANKEAFCQARSTIADYVMQRQPNWQRAESLLSRYCGTQGFAYDLALGCRREVSASAQGIVFADVKDHSVVSVVTPKAISYADYARESMKSSELSGERKVELAGRLLNGKLDIGSSPAHIAEALQTCIALSGATAPECVRLLAANELLAHKSEPSLLPLRAAMGTLVDLACYKSVTGEAALKQLLELDRRRAHEALRVAEERLLAQDKPAAVDMRQRLAQVYFGVAARWHQEPSLQARSYALYTWAGKLGDNQVMALVREHQVDKSPAYKPELLTKAGDPRINEMARCIANAADKNDPLVLQATLSLLAEGSTAVKPDIKELARVVFRQAINSRIDELESMSAPLPNQESGSQSAVTAKWQELDKLLEQSGQSNASFSRQYMRAKRLEAAGDYAGLASVYEGLAKTLAADGSANVAAFYRLKAADAQERVSPDVQAALDKLKTMLKYAERVKTSGDVAQLGIVDGKLAEALAAIGQRTGPDSAIMIEAHLAKYRYHRLCGNEDQANQHYSEATSLLRRRANICAPHLQVGETQVTGSAEAGKQKLFGGTRSQDREIVLSSNLHLFDSIEGLFGKAAIVGECARNLSKEGDRLLRENDQAHERLVQAHQLCGDAATLAGQRAKAERSYMLVATAMERNLGPDNIHPYQQLSLRRIQNLQMDPEKTLEAYQIARQTLDRCNQVNPSIVNPQLERYAAELKQRAQAYAQAGIK